ncbi:MAG: LmbE family N-acetylglucosaminyl deacetylase [Chlamydiales bacterium]|jgi:LmbE family N-acetylglucosaminyl deacetylase
MLSIQFSSPADRPLRVLCLGAHCDDIEIGCGGTIRSLIAGERPVDFCWTVFSSNPARAQEAQAGAQAFLEGAHEQRVVLHEFRESFFPSEWEGIKEAFGRIRNDFEPDVVFTHRREDLHQDHRVISELTGNAFRDHLLLEYEIPKFDGDLGQPNVFVPLTTEAVDFKVATLMRVFATQLDKNWFDEDTFRAILRLRGVESNAPDRFAEAFHARKLPLKFGA